MKLRRAGGLVLDVLFPRRCAWCGRVVGFGPACACAPQAEELRLPGAPLPPPRLGPLHIGPVWACYHYREPVRGALLRFKFEGEQALAAPLGDALAQKYAACVAAGGYGLVVPAPVSRRSLKARGYNQSALLARRLAGVAGLPCDMQALRKVAETAPQNTLAREARLTNLAGAFAAEPGRVQGRRVLLVDDIVTTGSTLNECAGALLAAGAACVAGLCVAAADGRQDMAR